MTGEWIPVGETAFLNEALPAEDEPGGPTTREFMQSFIPDASRLGTEWVTALRVRRQQDPEQALLSQAWDWIERHARSISLREIVVAAFDALMSSTSPDWSVLGSARALGEASKSA